MIEESKTQEAVVSVGDRTVAGRWSSVRSGGGGGSSSDPERQAFINDAPANTTFRFCDNSIVSAKYTLISFVPITLFEQFRRIANLYFLIMSVLMLLGDLYPALWYSPISYSSTLLPLVFVLMCTMVRHRYFNVLSCI